MCQLGLPTHITTSARSRSLTLTHLLIYNTHSLIPFLLCSSPFHSDLNFGAGRRNPAMQSLRSRIGSTLRRASGTFGTESDEERPPSPGGSSIKSTPSKRRRKISIFKSDGKRTAGGPAHQNTSDTPDAPVATVDTPAHTEALPAAAGDDSASTSTSLPKPLKVSYADTPAPDVEHPVSQPHQASEGIISPALTTEPTGEEQTDGAATTTAIPQTQTSTELNSANAALSSSVDMNASAFEVIPSMSEPEPAQSENDRVQGSVAVVQFAAAQGAPVAA